MKKYFFLLFFGIATINSNGQSIVTDSVETELGNFILETSENEILSEQDVVGDSSTTSDGGNAEYLIGINNGARRIQPISLATSEENLKVSPNPTSGITEVTLSTFTGNVEISIIDPLGRIIMQNVIFVQDERIIYIDVTKFDRGMYFLKVISQEKTQTIQLVKQ